MATFILLLGGKGTRFDAFTPKQFFKISSRYVFSYSLNEAIKTKLFDKYVIVVSEEYKKIISDEYDDIKIIYASNGLTRQESVYNGLSALKEYIQDDEIVMIHDGARPEITQRLIKDIFTNCIKHRCCIPFKESISSLYDAKNKEYINRSDIKQIETPQSFYFNDIFSAHKEAIKDNFMNACDDGILYNRYVGDLFLLLNKENNEKITTKEDLTKIVIKEK